MTKKQKVLVTGATGFVGAALINEFGKEKDFEILALTGKRKKVENCGWNFPVKSFSCDIADFATFPETDDLKNTDVLVHAAGLAHQFGAVKKEDFWRVNVSGTENACQMARRTGASHFVLISSSAVYGDYGKALIDEGFTCQPSGFYAESKLESEKRAIEFCEKNEIPLTILRLATVIGEGDHGNIARLITAIDKNKFFWIGNGANQKSLIYKVDAARGILKAIKKKGNAGTEIFNLTGEVVTMKQIVEAISYKTGKKIPQLFIPEVFLSGFFLLNRMGISTEKSRKLEYTLKKWLSDDIFSGEKFRQRFDFEPETNVAEAIARQVDYYLKRKNISK